MNIRVNSADSAVVSVHMMRDIIKGRRHMFDPITTPAGLKPAFRCERQQHHEYRYNTVTIMRKEFV